MEEKRSGRKEGNIITVLEGLAIESLPISLRHFQSFPYSEYDGIADFLPKANGDQTNTEISQKNDLSAGSGRTYKVGDYYNDGKKEGVVFDVWDDGKHGKIVSLDEEELPWCTKQQYDKKIVVGTDSKTDGKANTSKIMARSDRQMYSAFVWCTSKGQGWYLPAIEEIKLLLTNASVYDVVTRTLENKGATMFSEVGYERYWSSTEYERFEPEFYAWSIDIGYRHFYRSDKTHKFTYVRAVAQF